MNSDVMNSEVSSRSEWPEGVEVLRRILDEGFAAGDPAAVDELCSPDLVEHQFGLEATGPEAIAHLKEAVRQVHEMAPDIRYTIDDWSQRGDVTWVRVRATGTMTGSFFGPPSGRPLDITVIDVARVVGGRIVEHWGVPDRFALLAQSGVLARLSQRPVAPAPA